MPHEEGVLVRKLTAGRLLSTCLSLKQGLCLSMKAILFGRKLDLFFGRFPFSSLSHRSRSGSREPLAVRDVLRGRGANRDALELQMVAYSGLR
jgi:hypothetical protein